MSTVSMEIADLIEPGGRRRTWRREQAPGLDGDWLMTIAANGGPLAVAPPGVRIGPPSGADIVRWRVAWWPAEASAETLQGVPPSRVAPTSLVELLRWTPQRIGRWILATHRAAHREQLAAAARARTRDDLVATALATSRADALAAELREALSEDLPGARRPAREPSRVGRRELSSSLSRV